MTPGEAVAEYGGIRAAARALGVSYTTFRDRVARERASAVKAPAILSPDPPIDELITARRRAFERKASARASEQWAAVTVQDTAPIGILWFGDPHLDDDGCNWPLLEKHVAIAAETPGLYGANIGDTTNNWAGRLARLYAEQDTSRRTARRLARWFLAESGIDWLVWIMGNHDAWESGSDILRLMNPGTVFQTDWEARFRLVFPGRREVRVHAAHDFPGHSMWNIGHGPSKAARFHSDADLYVCGHKHDWTIQSFELAARGRCPTIIRARGYKWHDSYAVVHGFQQAQSGAGILTIINPASPDPAGRVLAFADVAAGADVLTVMRQRAAAKARRRAA